MSYTISSDIANLLRPGIDLIISNYPRKDAAWTQYFETRQSDKNVEYVVEMKNPEKAVRKNEQDAVTTTNMYNLFQTSFFNITYAIGAGISWEAISDNLYKDQWPDISNSLAQSGDETKRTNAALILTNAFNGALQTLASGQPLGSTTQPTAVGETYSNTFSIATALNETSIEDALIAMQQFIGANGFRYPARGEALIVPPAQMFQAERTINSKYTPMSANNAISVIHGQFAKGVIVDNYLANDSIWAVKSNIPGFIHYERDSGDVNANADPQTFAIYITYRERYSFGVSNARCTFVATAS